MRQLCLLVGLATFFAACNGNSSQAEEYKTILTAHKWKYDVPAILEEVEAAGDLGDGQKQVVKTVMERLKETTFHFMEDGRLLVNMPDATHEGTWVLDGSKPALKMDLSNTVANDEQIVSITPERIILEKDVAKGSLYQKNFIPATE